MTSEVCFSIIKTEKLLKSLVTYQKLQYSSYQFTFVSKQFKKAGFCSSTYPTSRDFQKNWDRVSPWSSHVWGPQKCKNFGPRGNGSRDNAKKPFLGHFWAIFGVFSKPCEIWLVIARRFIFWPMIELKTRFNLSHQLVPYLATRALSADCCENL